MKKLILGALIAVACSFGASAQAPIPGTLGSIGGHDLFQDVVGGVGQAAEYYATAGQIAGSVAYVNGGAVLTAFTYTFPAGVGLYLITPAGTLATGTLTAPAAPGDGQTVCFVSTQTQTALTFSANTGQTVTTGGTYGTVTLGKRACWMFSAATSAWYSVQ